MQKNRQKLLSCEFLHLSTTNFCPMSIEILTTRILNKISGIDKRRRDFIIHLFTLWLSIRGRYNYINLARYGKYREETYRNNSGRSFPFLAFNRKLVQAYLSTDYMIAFDPAHVSKSGKHTAGTGYYYSGCAGREKWGLEFGGIAAIDLQDKTALHLEAVQTLHDPEQESILEYYANQIISRAGELKKVSSLVAVDAYFSRAPFINALVKKDFQVVTRLRKDIVMRYLYHGPKQKGRGRPKKYVGKIVPGVLDEEQFSVCAACENGSWIAYEAVVNVRCWKRQVRVVIEHTLNETGDVKSYKIYACTDTDISGGEIKHTYNSRFQIEFLYRDAKQFVGLNHCQARSKEKLHFHINTALTMVSLSKAAFHLSLPIEKRKAFSMADIKNAHANELIFDRIISWCNIDLHQDLIKNARSKIRAFGKRAA